MDIIGIAKEVRKDFESRGVNQRLLQNLYTPYNNIPGVESFISAATEQFPQLGCGVASVYLRHVFQAGKVMRGKYLEHDHTFLLPNENLIDITSDQFGGPKVYVGPIQPPWSLK